jgi:hypothetical protein
MLLKDKVITAMTGSNVVIDGGMTSQLVSKELYQSRPIEGK